MWLNCGYLFSLAQTEQSSKAHCEPLFSIEPAASLCCSPSVSLFSASAGVVSRSASAARVLCASNPLSQQSHGAHMSAAHSTAQRDSAASALKPARSPLRPALSCPRFSVSVLSLACLALLLLVSLPAVVLAGRDFYKVRGAALCRCCAVCCDASVPLLCCLAWNSSQMAMSWPVLLPPLLCWGVPLLCRRCYSALGMPLSCCAVPPPRSHAQSSFYLPVRLVCL